jgi:cell wall-associated NlpC family hydrolase
MRRAVAGMALGLVLAACATTPRPKPAAALPLGERAALLARQYTGTPYRFGGSEPQDGFDCSGLVWYVYRSLGVAVPRSAADQQRASTPVAYESLIPGDLVFFHTPSDHVGIYLGHGEFIHAPSSGRGVTSARLDSPYYLLDFAGAGRISPGG